MNEKFMKFFEHEHLKLRIEFVLLNEKYIGHKIYKNKKLISVRHLDMIERGFFNDCYLTYADFLDGKGIDYYKGGEN